jgi:amino acid transporter
MNVMEPHTLRKKVKRAVFGKPKDLHDSGLFHKLALVPLLAWIGLGADGLSSSSYGPEEAFRALGSHSYLAVFLALGTILTVMIISYAYSRIIEHFPHGGGGYIVATHMLGEGAGVVSGSALLVDYVLTITVSIASCADALFSYLPMQAHQAKLPFALSMIVILIILNIRGIKESVTLLAPIFVVFIVTHVLLLGYGIFSHVGDIAPIANSLQGNLSNDLATIGKTGILLLFLRAYSLGGGTYTGIEAVSNGLQVMRDPKVQTGKRTMLYMAGSLALTAGGLFLCYLLVDVKPVHGMTLNAVLANTLFGKWNFGHMLALVTIISEGALLLVASQTGFIDGPRVMANMAVDSWFPHRFAAFSERLTMRNGVVLMVAAAFALMVYTKGSISALVVMYSINVFLTFSLSEFGMSRFWIKTRRRQKDWKKHLGVHLTGLTLCLTILAVTTFEKFTEGGWLTLVITTMVIMLCYFIKNHYKKVQSCMRSLDKLLTHIPVSPKGIRKRLDKSNMTAILLVSGYSGFGVHTLLSVIRSFPGLYKNFVFVSVAVIDQGMFKGEEQLGDLKKSTREGLKKYVTLARKLGFPADYQMALGTDVVDEAATLCMKARKEFGRSTVFTGQLTFQMEKFYYKILHNETAFAIQRRLQWAGIENVILPIRMDLQNKINGSETVRGLRKSPGKT